MIIYDVQAMDGNSYIYDEDKNQILTMKTKSNPHTSFIGAAKKDNNLVVTVKSYSQAVEKMGKKIAQEHFSHIPKKRMNKAVLVGIGLFALILLIGASRK